MNRLTKRTPNGIAYMAIADTLSKKDQEIEGSKPILEGLYAMFQRLADYEDMQDEFNQKSWAIVIGEYVIKKCEDFGIKLEDFVDGDVIEYLSNFSKNETCTINEIEKQPVSMSPIDFTKENDKQRLIECLENSFRSICK